MGAGRPLQLAAARLLVVGTALLTLAALTSTAHADPIYPGDHLQLKSQLSNFCMDADKNGGSRNGVRVQIWGCNGQFQQQWVVTPAAGNYSYIQNGWSGNCLDADLNTINKNGTVVQLWACNHSYQQQWQVLDLERDTTTGLRGFTIINRYSQRAIDFDTFTARQNGGKVQLWDQNRQLQQLFCVENWDEPHGACGTYT